MGSFSCVFSGKTIIFSHFYLSFTMHRNHLPNTTKVTYKKKIIFTCTSGEVSATASRSSTTGGGSGLSLKPGSTENLPSLAVDKTGTTSFPVGPCLLASHCFAPTHELRKKCPGCGKYIHALCAECWKKMRVCSLLIL